MPSSVMRVPQSPIMWPHQINEGTYPSFAVLIRDIAKQIQSYGSLAKIPAATVGNTRNDMYLASEAIRFLQKDKESDLSKADMRRSPPTRHCHARSVCQRSFSLFLREAYNTYYIRDTAYAIDVYGNGCVLEWCRTQGIASFFWQAFAPGWCNNRQFWPGANLHTFSLDTPPTCHRRLGRLKGWGKEGGWMLARSPLMPTRAKDVFPGAPLPISTPPIDAPAPRSGPLEPITRIAAASAIARYVWKDRGVAPAGYIKGMALVYARVFAN